MSVPDMENAAPRCLRGGVRNVPYPSPDAPFRKTPEPVSEYHGGGVLSRPLNLTVFPDTTGRTKRDMKRSLAEIATAIPRRVAARKDGLPLIKLGAFGNVATRKGSLRHNANVLAIEGVEGDHDAGTMTVQQARDRLAAAGLAGLIYTTPSHRPAKPRWRVLCPLSRPHDPEDRERLCARLNGALEGALQGESFTLSQTYFYGCVEGGSEPDVVLVNGTALDLAAPLDAGALGRDGKPYQPGAEEPDPEPVEDDDELPHVPDWERIGKALASIPADDRDTWLTVGMALHHEGRAGEQAYDAWDEWSRSSGKYNARDQRRVWDSFGGHAAKPVTIGTLYRLAPLPETFGGLTFESPAECATAPARGYLVKGMLAGGDVACIFGQPGAGKSLIAPHIGYMVARGEAAFGMRTKPGRVFYVAAEDTHGLRRRVAALRQRHGEAPEFRVVGGVSDLLADDSPDLEALTEAISEQRPALIFVDTLAMAFPGLEENDARSMGRVVAVARQLAEQGAAVVLIHHDTKDEGSTPRGHSILNGALDAAMHVKRDDEGIVRGRLTKNRNGACDRDIAFRIGVETLGHDEDGDPETAALAEELPASPLSMAPRLSHAQREALAVLRELEATGAVPEEAWRDACLEGRRVSQSEEREARKRAFNRAWRELAERAMIVFEGGNVAPARPDFERPEDAE